MPSAARCDEPAVGKRWALLIGVNSYVSMRSLDYCVDDMQAMRDQLIACGFPEGQFYLLRDKADAAARLPTKLNIEKRLKLLLSLVKEKHLVLVAFSGQIVEHPNGIDEWHFTWKLRLHFSNKPEEFVEYTGDGNVDHDRRQVPVKDL